MSWKNSIKKNEEVPRYGDNDWKPNPDRTQEYEDNIKELLYKLSDQLEYYYKSSGKSFGEKRLLKELKDIGHEKGRASLEYRYDV